MAANGISTLPTKQQRQLAKLTLSAQKRLALGHPRASFDLSQLPTNYQGNSVVDTANAQGLVLGRPWV